MCRLIDGDHLPAVRVFTPCSYAIRNINSQLYYHCTERVVIRFLQILSGLDDVLNHYISLLLYMQNVVIGLTSM